MASAAVNGNGENQGSFMLTADGAGADVAYTVVQAVNKMRGLEADHELVTIINRFSPQSIDSGAKYGKNTVFP